MFEFPLDPALWHQESSLHCNLVSPWLILVVDGNATENLLRDTSCILNSTVFWISRTEVWSIFNNNNNAWQLSRRCIVQKRYRDARFYRSISIFWRLYITLCLELVRTGKYHSAKLQPIRKSQDEGIACYSCFMLLAQPLRFQDHNLLQLDTLRLKTKRLRRDFRIGTAERGRIVSRGFSLARN